MADQQERRNRPPAAHNWKQKRRAIAALSLTLLAGSPQAAQPDPPVPAGRNPGGFPVALLGTGVDYTHRNVSQMLARDGEGEIIGYDMIDDDRRPYAVGPQTDAAEILLAEGQAATLVVVRANVETPKDLAAAVGYATRSPARIVTIFADAAKPDIADVLTAAAKQFPRYLFIASIDALDGQRSGAEPRPANLLIVTNAKDVGNAKSDADLSVAIDDIAQPRTQSQATPSHIALARTAALAARLAAVAANASAADIKARIILLAEPPGVSGVGDTRSGYIAHPRRHFWLE